jgi:hypothetical protein
MFDEGSEVIGGMSEDWVLRRNCVTKREKDVGKRGHELVK